MSLGVSCTLACSEAPNFLQISMLSFRKGLEMLQLHDLASNSFRVEKSLENSNQIFFENIHV